MPPIPWRPSPGVILHEEVAAVEVAFALVPKVYSVDFLVVEEDIPLEEVEQKLFQPIAWEEAAEEAALLAVAAAESYFVCCDLH